MGTDVTVVEVVHSLGRGQYQRKTPVIQVIRRDFVHERDLSEVKRS